MAAKNRAALINKVLKVVKKHYKPAPPPKDRSLLQHLLFACCLENSSHDAAEKVFHALSTDYFDWNEVRVSTVRELGEAMKPFLEYGWQPQVMAVAGSQKAILSRTTEVYDLAADPGIVLPLGEADGARIVPHADDIREARVRRR